MRDAYDEEPGRTKRFAHGGVVATLASMCYCWGFADGVDSGEVNRRERRVSEAIRMNASVVRAAKSEESAWQPTRAEPPLDLAAMYGDETGR